MAQIYQIARPVADVSVGAWLNQVDAGVNLFQSFDEAEPYSGSDYAYARSSFLGGDPDLPYLFTLSGTSDPGTDEGHVLSWHARGADFDLAGNRNYRWELINTGTNVIATGTREVAEDVDSHETVALSPAEVALLATFYGAPRFRFTLLGQGSDWSLRILQFELRVPLTFAHLDHSGAGLRQVAAASGQYLEDSGPGFRLVSGLEGSTALLHSGAGLRRRGSS